MEFAAFVWERIDPDEVPMTCAEARAVAAYHARLAVARWRAELDRLSARRAPRHSLANESQRLLAGAPDWRMLAGARYRAE